MIYQELINNIRDLGFSDDAEMEEFGELVPNNINRAITEINLEVAPIIERYEFDLKGDTVDSNGQIVQKGDTGYLYITMPDIDENFLDFADTPVHYSQSYLKKEKNDQGVWEEKLIETPLYTRFNDYEIEANDTIVINVDGLKLANNQTYSFRVFYKVLHTPFDGSQLDTRLPLPLKVHHLVPLLASYYIWLEDEPTKAAQYYNLYEQAKADLTINAKPRMRVLSGGI